jgi:hypothetical protein
MARSWRHAMLCGVCVLGGCVRAGFEPGTGGGLFDGPVLDAKGPPDQGDGDARDLDLGPGPLDQTIADQGLVPPTAGSDDFDDGVFDTSLFQVSPSGGCAVVEADGVARFTVPANETCFSLLITKQTVDLTGRAFYIKVPQHCQAPVGTQTVMYVSSPGYKHCAVVEGGHFVVFWYDPNNAMEDFDVSAPTTYDPVADLWWRFREQAGVLYFETAPAGTGPWRERFSKTAAEPVNAVRLWCGAGARLKVNQGAPRTSTAGTSPTAAEAAAGRETARLDGLCA